MLKINLLKKTSGKKKPGKTTNPGGPIVLSAIVFVLLAGGAFYWYTNFKGKTSKSAAVTTPVTTDYKASTHSGVDVIEEVVKEVNASKVGSPGFVDIAYKDMGFNERITYEVLYAKNALEMLSRTFPEGIGLRKLQISKFQTIYAVGLGDTKELIGQTFNALRRERVELLPKPFSFITSNGKGFRFNVTVKTEFGLDFADRFQAIDHLVSREFLSDQVKKVVTAADRDEVRLKGEPIQLSVENVGGYRRYIYNIKAECTYKNFVRFVMDLYNEQIPCAFKEVNINAQAGSLISVDAEILITVKNN